MARPIPMLHRIYSSQGSPIPSPCTGARKHGNPWTQPSSYSPRIDTGEWLRSRIVERDRQLSPFGFAVMALVCGFIGLLMATGGAL